MPGVTLAATWDSSPCHTDGALLWLLRAAAATAEESRPPAPVQEPVTTSHEAAEGQALKQRARGGGAGQEVAERGICFLLLPASRDREGKQLTPGICPPPRIPCSRMGRALCLWVTLGHPAGRGQRMQAHVGGCSGGGGAPGEGWAWLTGQMVSGRPLQGRMALG